VEQVYLAFVSNNLKTSNVQYRFPNNKAHTQDATSLIITNLHIKVTRQGENITSFFVRRFIYFAFFSKLSRIRINMCSHLFPPQDLNFKEMESLPLQQSHPNHALNISERVHGNLKHEATD